MNNIDNIVRERENAPKNGIKNKKGLEATQLFKKAMNKRHICTDHNFIYSYVHPYF